MAAATTGSRNLRAGEGLFSRSALRGEPREHAPVQPQMQRHQHKAPVRSRHVQKPREGHAAVNVQKGEYMVGEHDPLAIRPSIARKTMPSTAS